MQSLSGKAIVIIGGTTGLGLSAAQRIISEGGSIVAVGRKPADATAVERELGDQARALVGDAIHHETSVKAIDHCLASFGTFDGLYHVAGGSGRKMGDGPLHEVTDEGIQATLDLNLKSLIMSNRAAVTKWRELSRGGAILNMASVLGHSPSPKFFATHVYAAAKAAIIGFSKSIASYYADSGIRVNVICPALVETPMAQRAAGDERILRFISTKQPLDGGRIGRPSDLDAAVIYFLSDGAAFCTGQALNVDGGWSISEGQIHP